MQLTRYIYALAIMFVISGCNSDTNEVTDSSHQIFFVQDGLDDYHRVTELSTVTVSNGQLIIPMDKEDSAAYKVFARANNGKLYSVYLNDHFLGESMVMYYDTDYSALSLNFNPKDKQRAIALIQSSGVKLSVQDESNDSKPTSLFDLYSVDSGIMKSDLSRKDEEEVESRK